MIYEIWRCLPVKRNDVITYRTFCNHFKGKQQYSENVALYLIWRQSGQGFNDSSQGHLGLFGHVGIAGHVVGCTTDVAWTRISYKAMNIMHI